VMWMIGQMAAGRALREDIVIGTPLQ
jgi:hypothetical protein